WCAGSCGGSSLGRIRTGSQHGVVTEVDADIEVVITQKPPGRGAYPVILVAAQALEKLSRATPAPWSYTRALVRDRALSPSTETRWLPSKCCVGPRPSRWARTCAITCSTPVRAYPVASLVKTTGRFPSRVRRARLPARRASRCS